MLLRIDQDLRLSDTADSLKKFNNESVLQKASYWEKREEHQLWFILSASKNMILIKNKTNTYETFPR